MARLKASRAKSRDGLQMEQSRPDAGADKPVCSEFGCAKIAAKKRQRLERARSLRHSPSSFDDDFWESATANRSVWRVRMAQAASAAEQVATGVVDAVRISTVFGTQS